MILASKNYAVCKINKQILGMFEDQQDTYLSIDFIVNRDQAKDYPVEILNS